MSKNAISDYAASGLTLQQAMVDLVKRYPEKSRRPDHILWNGKRVKTADAVEVPRTGRIAVEFLSPPTVLQQGFDMKLDGYFELAGGERVSTLRTWHLPSYDAHVEYTYQSRDGLVWVWNVYKIDRDGEVVEKWTGNAGLWVEIISPTVRVYHCSPGSLESPNFESLVFKMQIVGTSR